MTYYGLKMDVVRFAAKLQVLSNENSLSITITRLGRSGVYSVTIATDTLSAGTVAREAVNYSLLPTNISRETTSALSFLPKKPN